MSLYICPNPWNVQLKVKVAQLCPALCDPMDYSPPGSHIHWILQARILEWVAVPFSGGYSQPRVWIQVSHIAGGYSTNWATREAQEYWSGQPIPSSEDLSDQESNWGLLHCRQVLYQLSYQGSSFGATKYKIYHCFHFPPSISHEVMGPDAMVFIFWMFSLSQLIHSPLLPS